MELTSHQTALFGLILPPLLSVVIQPKWSSRTKSLASLFACMVATVCINAYDHQLSLDGMPSMMLTMFVAYRAFYRPTGLSDVIEEKTSPISDVDEEEDEEFTQSNVVEEDNHVVIPLVISKSVIGAMVTGVECKAFCLVDAPDGRFTIQWIAPDGEDGLVDEDVLDDVVEEVNPYTEDSQGLPR